MIVWVNGPFGAGKTTTTALLQQALDGALLFDPEEVGFVIRQSFPEGHPQRHKDFQDYPMWPPLVAQHAIHLEHYTKAPVIAPMTLLRHDYADTIFSTIRAAGIELRHLLIHADPQTLRARIEGSSEFPDDEVRSEKVRAFRRRKLADYESAYDTWLRDQADVIDTSSLTPEQAAEQAVKLLRS
ncbi:AAA family ATPase [Streptacidiphilus sp. N1-3]|uniref:AAA family ATPase n=1 Tax=Streptacidiphilus alkalitolerans TaxID=3342712 RepID=A0ABV6XAU8_9ACTN